MDCHENLINHLPEHSISWFDPIQNCRLHEDRADVYFKNLGLQLVYIFLTFHHWEIFTSNKSCASF